MKRFKRLSGITILIAFSLVGCSHRHPHWVKLSWDASTATATPSVATYSIYRSTTSGGPFARLASGVRETWYEDHLVVSGRTYFYVVTATDRVGNESKFSSEVRAQIP